MINIDCPGVGRTALALIFIASAPTGSVAHESTSPRLRPESLDQGIHVEVRHPRVIRNRSPLTISVVVENMLGDDEVTVKQVRYRMGPKASGSIRTPDHRLPTKRNAYLKYLSVEADLESASRAGDRVPIESLIPDRTRLLALMHRDSFIDSFTIKPDAFPVVGEPLTVYVDVDLVQDGGVRTVKRTINIPVQAPLPTGSPSLSRMRYDASSGALEVLPDRRPSGTDESGVGQWFAGDQHLHTTYSMDAAILDGTSENVWDYASVAEAGGLDWIIATDHSNIDFDFLGLAWYTPEQFAAGTVEAASYTLTHDFLALCGQEMGTGSGFPLGMPAHYLVYPALTDTTGFIENPCSGYLLNVAFCEDYQVIIDRVAKAGGIGFIAHPTDAGILYVPWDFDEVAVGWSGMEIWTSSSGRLGARDESAYDLWHRLLLEVRRPVEGRLLDRPGIPTLFPVGIGNSDAHVPGSVGATFTYARMSQVTREGLMFAFLTGQAVASNGPLLFGQINGAGIGDVATGVDQFVDMEITLQTTPEFGPVGNYSITVNVNGEPRTEIQIDNDTDFSATIQVMGLDFALPDKMVTIRADSLDGTWHAFTNPIWLDLPRCIGDVNEDMTVDIIDFILVLFTRGPCQGCPTDINRDGVVNLFDLIAVILNEGPCGD